MYGKISSTLVPGLTGSGAGISRRYAAANQTPKSELLVNLEKGIYTPPGRLTMEKHRHNWLEGYG